MRKILFAIIILVLALSLGGLAYSMKLKHDILRDSKLFENAKIDLTKSGIHDFPFEKLTSVNQSLYINIYFPDLFVNSSDPNYKNQIKSSHASFDSAIDKIISELKLKAILRNRAGDLIFADDPIVFVKAPPYENININGDPLSGLLKIRLGSLIPQKSNSHGYDLNIEVIDPIPSIQEAKASSLYASYAPKELVLFVAFINFISVSLLIAGLFCLLVFVVFNLSTHKK